MASEVRVVFERLGHVLGRADTRGPVRLTAGAVEALVRLVREAAAEARERSDPSAEAGVACVLQCIGRWPTYPEVPAELTALTARVLRGRGDDAAWVEAVSTLLTAEGVEHKPPAAVGQA
jgi:hypothetical protein